jgi:hypothetical protein
LKKKISRDESYADSLPKSCRHFFCRGHSKTQYYDRMGFTRRKQKLQDWIDADVSIKEFGDKCPTPKTASTEDFKAYAKYTLENLQNLLGFYVKDVRYRRLEWETKIASKRGLEAMVTDIMGCPGINKRVPIAHGASGMDTMRGCRPMGNKRLLRKIMQRATVVLVDEYCTSKNCCACYHELGEFDDDKKEGTGWQQDDKTGRYRVRHCKRNECFRRLWNRDVSDTRCIQKNKNIIAVHTHPSNPQTQSRSTPPSTSLLVFCSSCDENVATPPSLARKRRTKKKARNRSGRMTRPQSWTWVGGRCVTS